MLESFVSMKLNVHQKRFVSASMRMVRASKLSLDSPFTHSLGEVEVILLGTFLSHKINAPAVRIEESNRVKGF
jgi:hypothetical protein